MTFQRRTLLAMMLSTGLCAPGMVLADDGTIKIGVLATFEVQCWADTRLVADAVAESVQAAIEAANQDVSNRASVYEADLDFEGESLTVDWWDDLSLPP